MPDEIPTETTEQPHSPIVIFDEFLVAEEWRALLDFTLGNMAGFTTTQVIGADGTSRQDTQYRRSRVLFELGYFHDLFSQRLLTFLPHVLSRIGWQPFPVTQMEIQLTGTNNGEFFRMHTDNDSSHVSGRALTFVYFFHREPLAFSGGELCIYDTIRNNGSAAQAGPRRILYPSQNQVVFFDSACLHEVLPVHCPSGDFGDSRLTVNGWFHR